MNAPAKRFSLQHLPTTTPAPAPSPAPAFAEALKPAPAKPPEPALVAPSPAPIAAPPPELAAVSKAPRSVSVPTRLAKTQESHPKKKRSYSVDMKLCEDLEILAWYMSRSSSSVVEELIRKHLQHNTSVLLKAREVRSSR